MARIYASIQRADLGRIADRLSDIGGLLFELKRLQQGELATRQFAQNLSALAESQTNEALKKLAQGYSSIISLLGGYPGGAPPNMMAEISKTLAQYEFNRAVSQDLMGRVNEIAGSVLKGMENLTGIVENLKKGEDKKLKELEPFLGLFTSYLDSVKKDIETQAESYQNLARALKLDPNSVAKIASAIIDLTSKAQEAMGNIARGLLEAKKIKVVESRAQAALERAKAYKEAKVIMDINEEIQKDLREIIKKKIEVEGKMGTLKKLYGIDPKSFDMGEEGKRKILDPVVGEHLLRGLKEYHESYNELISRLKTFVKNWGIRPLGKVLEEIEPILGDDISTLLVEEEAFLTLPTTPETGGIPQGPTSPRPKKGIK